MSTGGEEVGKISIRVVPELDRFRAELLKELQFWEKKTLKIKVEAVGVQKVREDIQAAAKDAKADIKTEATNVAQTRAKIKAGVDGIKSVVKVEVDQASLLDRFERRIASSAERAVANYEPKLNLTVDDEILRRSIEDRLTTLKGLTSLPVHVDPEIATKDKLFLEAEFQSILTTLQAHADADKIKIKFDADAIKANEDMQRALSKMRNDKAAKEAAATHKAIMQIVDTRSEIAVIKLDLDRKMFDLKMLELRSQEGLKAIEMKAKIKPDADMGAFARVKFGIEALFSNIRVRLRERKWTAADLLPNMDELKTAGDGLAKVGANSAASLPSLFSFAGMLLVVAAAVAVLLPPILALAAGLITLIPAFAAVLVPIGAVMLGLGGIKKAAENAGLFTDKNGSKKGGGSVGAALDAIKQKVSDTFEKGLTPAFEQLPKLFDRIKEPMAGVAQGLTDMTTGFINAITSTNGLNAIDNIIAKVGQGLTAAAPGIQSFTTGILNLVSAIANHFPGLGKTFSDLGQRFSEAVASITAPDPVTGISRLDTMMRNLGDATAEVGGFIRDLFVQGFNDMSNIDFGKSLKTFLNDLRTFITTTLPGLTEGFKSFARSLDSISPALNTLGRILDIFTRISNVMDHINKLNPFSLPGMSNIKTSWDALFNGQDLKFNVGDGGLIDTIKGYLNGPIQVDAAEAGKNAGQKFADGWTGGGGSFGGGVDISGAISDQLNTVTTASVEAQKAAIRSVFTGDTISGAVKAQIGAQLSGVITEVQAQMSTLGPALDTAVNSALVPLQSMPQRVSDTFAAIPAAVTGAFALIVMNIGTQAGAITTAVSQAFSGIPQAISGSFSQISGIVSQVFQPIVTGAQQSMTQTNTAITEGANQAVQTVSEIPGKMQAAISGSAGILAPAGTALMGGLKSGIVAGMADVLSYVDTIAGQIAAHKGPLPQDRQELIPAGEALMQGLGDGLDSGFQGVLDRTKAMAKAIFEAMKEVFGTASGANFNFNFGGAQGQIADMAGSAKTFSSSMGNYANAVKPAKIDAATQAQLDGLKQQNAAIDVQVAQLREQKFNTDKAGKAALDSQIAELNARKANITATLKQMEYEAKYSDQAQQTDLWKGMNEKIANGVTNVGQGVINSFASDLGISGNGALQGIAQYGMDLGSKFIFNVANMDDALMAKDREVNKQALSFVP